MRKRWLKLAALPIAFTFVAAACSTEDDDDGAADTEAPGDTGGSPAPGTTEAPGDTGGTAPATTTGGTGATESTPLPTGPGAGSEGSVTVFGVENSDNEAGAMQDALTAFGEETGIDITYVGARDFEQQINAQVLGGNPPDIAIFPQPGKVKQFVDDGSLLEIPDETVAAVADNWPEDWMNFTNFDGTQFGIPLKSDLKSLVWYIPSVWAENGYEVPTTLTEFRELVDQMIADGNTPLCVGIESGPATGWPFTDWVEELVLREQGVDYYNQWVTHEVPFDDAPVVEAFNEVAGPDGFWTKEGASFAVGGSIAATPFSDNSEPLLNGDCMMHRQANFFAAFFPEGTEFGEGPDQVSTFYFPSDEGKPVLVGGVSAGAFRDAPEVWQVIEYFGSPEFANARQTSQSERVGSGFPSGYLTANLNADAALFNEIETSMLETLTTADPAAFDASDQMPADVGSGTFWSEGTSFVNGDEDAEAAAGNIEASWPS